MVATRNRQARDSRNYVFHFIANLKDYTYHRGRGVPRFDSYLLSIDFAEDHRDLARKAADGGHTLVADNGNFDRIRELRSTYVARAEAIDNARREIEESVGRYLRPDDVPVALQRRFRAFAEQVATEMEDATPAAERRRVLDAQLALRPRYLIGAEDFTLPLLVQSNVEPEYAGLPRAFFEARAERAVRYAAEEAPGRAGPSEVFAGLHAVDYDSAYAAGRVAGQAEVAGIATGLGVALSDRNWVDFHVRHGNVVELERSIPRSYLRVVQVAAGLLEGYADASGRRPRFHALGVGTPILLTLLATMGDRLTFLGSDSTAPIMDAWWSPTVGMYVDSPAPMKYKGHRIAQHWIEDDIPWGCECPYCRRFEARHPPDLDGARRWWRSAGMPTLRKFHLHSDEELPRYLPLLGFHPDEELAREAALARVGHNHWILSRLERAARDASFDPEGLREWSRQAVAAYRNGPAGEAWKAAVEVASRMADDASRRLESARSTPPLWTRRDPS